MDLGPHLPKTERIILARGQVVMSLFDDATKEYSHGVAFTYIAQSDQEAIVTFVQLDTVRGRITSDYIVNLKSY